jgi:protein ImuB
MKGEVGSCCHPPISPNKKWETIKPRPTAPQTGAKAKQAAERQGELRHIIAILHKWGIHSLGQLAALNKEQLGNRLGPEAVRMWERANGRATRLLKFVQPPEVFAETFEFENEVETIEPLLFMLRRFLQQFSLRLGALYVVARDLKLCITFSDKTSYEHLFRIPEPSNNVEVLFRMLHTHLENYKSESPIIAVSLEARPTKPSRQQFSLFENALRDPTQLSETLARLTGLLGAERVGTPVLEETHRPDAFRMEPFRWELPEAEAKPEVPSAPALRRLRSPAPASVFLDDGKPAHFRSTQFEGPVVDQSGPYRASGNWWDEKAWARAEWDLELAAGVLCRCHAEGEAWQLDGVYD